MRVSARRNGLTVRVIAGTHTALLGFDLAEAQRAGCLGFAVQRTDLGPVHGPGGRGAPEWLLNRLSFPAEADAKVTEPEDMLVDFRPPAAAEPAASPLTTYEAPWQSFRFVDSGLAPGRRYRYRVVVRTGPWPHLQSGPAVSLIAATEDPAAPASAVFFNRAAASSQQYLDRFGDKDPDELPPERGAEARAWLSRGLEEGLLAFLAEAAGPRDALHAAIYEFQKPELLAALAAARRRGAAVQVVYHADAPGADGEHTGRRNAAAAAAAGLTDVCVKRTRQAAISHNKFVVRLRDGRPQAVWTGSTNWTEGALYGQLNVGHAVIDAAVAGKYERYFQLLHADTARSALVNALAELNALPDGPPAGPGVWPIFSPAPQKDAAGGLRVIDLFAQISRAARCLLVCAPFALHPQLTAVLLAPDPAGPARAARPLRFMLLNMENNLGAGQQVSVIDGQPGREVSVAVTLKSPLHDYQDRLLAGPESFRHQGIHVHAKFILADPLGDDPVLVTGSANFSANSTESNDENSLILRGPAWRAAADIYLTEFFRMFDSYSFRGKQQQKAMAGQRLALATDDGWTRRYYEPDEHGDTDRMVSRQLFAGTLPAGR